MGIKQVELVPIASTGPTQLTPASKVLHTKVFQVDRAVATNLKAVLGASATVMNVATYGSVNSDSATSSTLTITIANNTGTISTGAVDVKANGATTAIVQMSALPNIESLPANGDLRISAQYAEVGASTTGGPWKVRVDYV
jgi:hypothetical protein